jgi:hypothetical protein
MYKERLGGPGSGCCCCCWSLIIGMILLLYLCCGGRRLYCEIFSCVGRSSPAAGCARKGEKEREERISAS